MIQDSTVRYLGSTMSHWDFGRPPASEHDGPGPASPFGTAGDETTSDEGWAANELWAPDDDDLDLYPITYERDPWFADSAQPDNTRPDRDQPDRDQPDNTRPDIPRPDAPLDTAVFPGADWEVGRIRRRRGRHARRWLLPAGLAATAAALGAGAVLLAGGHPGSHQGGTGRPAARNTPGTPATHAAPGTKAAGGSTAGATAGAAAGATAGGAPLTMAQAQAVLAGYTTANNTANGQRSDSVLATIETGSSYAIDAALYRQQQAAGAAPYAPFSPVSATFYIPRSEPAAGPRWFVVQVANAFAASPAKISSSEYLLFTQPAPGAAWRNAVEPYLLSGASAVKIALGADGLASAVSQGTATDAVAPGQLPAVTAAGLDGAAAGQSAVADPGNLADGADLRLWRKEVPGGTVTDTHAPAAGALGQEFALLTDGGGALVFYTDAASLTVTPPAGSMLHVTIPGLYSPSQGLSQAGVSYLEQFAAYDPPAGGGPPSVVADYSAITGNSSAT